MRKEASKTNEIYRQLKRQIVMSEIMPSQQLTELELANTLECSQSTVREALMRLQEDGLIVRQGYRGTSVTSMSEIEAKVFLDLRTRLEILAARLSLSSLQPEHIDALKERIREMEQAAIDNDEYRLFEKDQEFHIQLFGHANLPTLMPMMARYSMYSHRNKIASHSPRTLLDTAQRHWKIIDALESKDAEAVEHILQYHVFSIAGNESQETPQKPKLQMSPNMAEVFSRIQQEDKNLPDPTTIPLEQARQQFEQRHQRWNVFDHNSLVIKYFNIPANPLSAHNKAPIPAVRITAKGISPAGNILYLHGGGWVFGSAQTHLGSMVRLAQTSECNVIGIDYRLAPEAPFPAGLNDCTWAWRWLHTQQDNDKPWYVAGDSSGANLALAMMLDLRHTGEILPDAAMLFYGVYSSHLDTESHRLCGQGEFGLTSQRMGWYCKQYLSGNRCDGTDPRAFPLNADLSGLPPLLVSAAGLDPLRDDSIQLVQRLSGSGTSVEFKLYPKVIHGFMQMSHELPEAQQAFSDAAAFLKRFHNKTRREHSCPKQLQTVL